MRLADTPEHAAVDGTVITMTPALVLGEPRIEALFAPCRECVALRCGRRSCGNAARRGSSSSSKKKSTSSVAAARASQGPPSSRVSSGRGWGLQCDVPALDFKDSARVPDRSRQRQQVYERNFYVNGEDGGGCNRDNRAQARK